MSYEPGDFRDIEVKVHRAGPVGHSQTRDAAIREAVATLEAAVEHLQQPPLRHDAANTLHGGEQ